MNPRARVNPKGAAMAQNSRLFRWTLAAFLVVALAFALWPLRAGASEPEQFTYRWYKQDRVWGQYYCQGEYRPEGCWRRWRHHKPSPNPDIMAAQIRLQHLGYEIDADGFMGAETREALTRFQFENDLKASGELDHATKLTLHEIDRGGDGEKEQAWSHRPEICRDNDGRECTCRPIIVFSGEHVGKDAKAEAVKRWRGHVRALIGETFMNWDRAPEPKTLDCWYTGTGERTSDKLGQTRCVAQARACFGPPAPQDPTHTGE
jgi:hypothetical protein